MTLIVDMIVERPLWNSYLAKSVNYVNVTTPQNFVNIKMNILDMKLLLTHYQYPTNSFFNKLILIFVVSTINIANTA